MPPSRITVLISGNGSNLQAIMDACRSGIIPNANIIRVISNREKAYGLERAKNIPTGYHNLLKYKKQHPATPEGVEAARETYFQDLASIILEDRPDIVVCAGWMLIVTSSFLDKLAAAKVPIINLHPALPGGRSEFNGINAIERAYEAFQQGKIKKTGIMIHYVIKEVDEGAPIITRELLFKEGESLNEVETRIHELEWQAIVEGTKIAINNLLQARVEA
ncbi:phosphoribosylglycinamide formyltransferase [Physcia stellaris]|nr:phosphoribosylglycinamide formyltransferase [Physcia stellaris]